MKFSLPTIVALVAVIVLIVYCFPHLKETYSNSFSSEDLLPFRDLRVSDDDSLTADLVASVPFDASMPRNVIASHLTTNPTVDRWLSNAVIEHLNTVRDRVARLGGDFVSRGYKPQITAVLVDGNSHIRAMFSNARSLYFGSDALPIASVGKFLLPFHLASMTHQRPSIASHVESLPCPRSTLRCPQGVGRLTVLLACAKLSRDPCRSRSYGEAFKL
jgi:hypothetical protein